MNREEYLEFLRESEFNDSQIKLIVDTRVNFEAFEKENENSEDYLIMLDGWERDQWYTFNQSGLFESDDDNVSDITDWEQSDTRRYITEIEIIDIRKAIYPI